MVTANDFFHVMCAMVPLYFAMLLAYASVKWCKIFTPDQSSGINRFVAVFAIPVLSFYFISDNNPYQMDSKFIMADTISKLFVLLFLFLWAIFFSAGSLDWLITLFSLATLPNTLIMGMALGTWVIIYLSQCPKRHLGIIVTGDILMWLLVPFWCIGPLIVCRSLGFYRTSF